MAVCLCVCPCPCVCLPASPRCPPLCLLAKPPARVRLCVRHPATSVACVCTRSCSCIVLTPAPLARAQNIGSYMFRVDEEIVVDATCKGNEARFINHCCEVRFLHFAMECVCSIPCQETADL